jgi:GH25 family lysozyme M1 (1,4-beta-N-acetylmuramidase)
MHDSSSVSILKKEHSSPPRGQSPEEDLRMPRITRLATTMLALAALTAPVRAQTYLEGVDVSLYQDAIDWPALKAGGVEFAFVRATRGEAYNDPLFLANMHGAAAAGMPVGAYHFCRLETNYVAGGSPVADATAEANHFLSVIKPFYDAGQMLPPVADVEGFPSFPNTTTARNYTSAWTQVFSDTIYNALGVRPLIYGSLSKVAGSGTYYTSTVANQHDLWLAWWKGTGGDDPPTPGTPYPTAADTPLWGAWTFWQWTDHWTRPGINGAVDGDLFNGTQVQLLSLLTGGGPMGGLPGGRIVLTNFDGADFDSTEAVGIEGYFMNSPTYSGSTTGVVAATTTATRSTDLAQEGVASQRLFVDSTGGAWTVRHLSGIGAAPGSAAANLPLDSTGSIGFWLNTTSANVTVQLYVDDQPSGMETSTVKSVIADGQWHLYEWQFDDAAQWNNASGGNGTIDGAQVTIDAIVLKGNGDSTIYIDTFAHNPNGSLAPIAGDFNADWLVNDVDYELWKAGFGPTNFGGADFLAWQRSFNPSPAASPAAAAVPEPAAAWLAVALLCCAKVMTRQARAFWSSAPERSSPAAR